MRTIPNHLLAATAGLVFLCGAGYAGNLYLNSTPEKMPNTDNIARLAKMVANTPAVPNPGLNESTPDAGIVTPPPAITKPDEKSKPATATKPTKPTAPPPSSTAVTAAPQAVIDPTKFIALLGVTHQEGKDSAYLMDINNRDHVTAGQGESAFGFTVSDIQPESVVLTRGSEKYTVRLGDKMVPGETLAISGGEATADGIDDGSDPFAAGPFGPRGRGGNRGAGGRGFGGNGRNGRNGAGGRNGFGGFGGFGGAAALLGGGFGGGGGGGFGGGGGNRGGGGGFGGGGGVGGSTSSTANSPTANAQTARRTGVSLESGVTSMSPLPTALQNPQTFRRNGTNSGPAFGSAQANGTASNTSGVNATSTGRQGLGYGQGVGTTGR